MSEKMIRIPLPDGRFAELPSSMSPEEMASALNAMPGATPPEKPASSFADGAKKVGSSLAAGFGETVGGVMQLPGLINQVLTKNKPQDGGFVANAFEGSEKPGPVQHVGKTVSDYWTGFDAESGMEAGFPKTFVKGVGGALATPFPGGVAANLLSGGVGAVGADFAAKAAPEGWKGGAAFLGGALTGGLAGAATSSRLSLAQMDLNEALRGTSKNEFDAAGRLLADFQKSGSKTFTVGEAFPDNVALQSVLSTARNADTKGPNALRSRTAGRRDDLLALTNRTVAEIDPSLPDPGVVSSTVAKAADSRIADLRKARSSAYGSTIASAPDVDPRVLMVLENWLKQKATDPLVSIPQQKIYAEFAKGLQRSDGALHTDLRTLVDIFKLAKDSPLTRGASTASKAEQELYDQVYDVADNFLKVVSPTYKKAEDAFIKTSADVIDPAEASALGKLASPNYKPNRPVPTGRLTAINEINDPTELRRILGELQRGAPNTPNIARQIASALAQRKTQGGAVNARTALAGEKISPQNRNFNELLSVAGVDQGQIGANMRTAEALQGNTGPVTLGGPPMPLFKQVLIRPFRTLDMAVTATGEATLQRQIAEVLARQDTATLEELRRIAMFNPDVRRALTLAVAARSGANLTGE